MSGSVVHRTAKSTWVLRPQGSPAPIHVPANASSPWGSSERAVVEGRWMGESSQPAWLLPALGTPWQGANLQLSPKLTSVWKNSIHRPEIPVEIVPEDAKTCRASSCKAAQCSPCALLLLGFGWSPKKPPKELVCVFQRRSNPC